MSDHTSRALAIRLERRSPRPVAGALLSGTIGLACIVAAVLAWRASLLSPDWPGLEMLALCAAMLAAIFLGLLVISWFSSAAGAVRARQDVDGVLFPESPLTRWGWAAAWVVSWLFPVELYRIHVVEQWPVDRLVTGTLWAGTVLAITFPVMVLRRRPGGVLVGPEGVDVRLGGARWSVPWGSVLPPRPARFVLAAMLAGGRRVPERDLASDPAVVAEFVDLYRTRPQLRHELTDGAALRRLAEDRLR